jgi:hypothetical protein
MPEAIVDLALDLGALTAMPKYIDRNGGEA